MKQIKSFLFIIMIMVVAMFSSCEKEEILTEQPQVAQQALDFKTPINKWDFPSTTRAIGGENFFEDHVNIEDFKDFQYEPKSVWDFQQAKLDSLAKLDKFPNEKDGVDRANISRQLTLFAAGGQDIVEVFENGLQVNYQKPKAFLDEYSTLPKVEAHVEVIYKDSYSYALSPKEAFNFSYTERIQMRRAYLSKNGHYYQVAYVPIQHYARITGLGLNYLKSLRIITFTRNQLMEAKECDNADFTCYIYQFPYKDNYKDYYNESLKMKDKWQMKKYFKPGSFLFVFNKPLDKLYDGEPVNRNNGHTIIVTDRYTLDPDNYHSLNEYNRLKAGQSFMDIPELRKAIFDPNVSLRDFLKHFLFIEAVTTSENEHELDGGLILKSTFKVKHTAGNDSLALERFDNYTIFAISNLNKGLQKSNWNLVSTMLENSEQQMDAFYNVLPNDVFASSNYCSGLVYFGFYNKGTYPSINLLKKEHSSSAVIRWYMPRTLTNSPFVYTRIWYTDKK